MRFLFVILLIIFSRVGLSQDASSLLNSMGKFHLALLNEDSKSVDQYIDKALSYGHSNGWIETRGAMLKNLQTGFISYSKFKVDSIVVGMSEDGKSANLRFIAEITATLNGSTADYHLRVLEVWVKKGKRWLLFGRQGIKK